MSRCQDGAETKQVRTIFISDAHLGCRFARPQALLNFLTEHDCEQLYIVGDFIDGWRLHRAWFWRAEYNRILIRLLEMAQQGTLIHYAPGNHDEFLRPFATDFGLIDVAEEFVHETAHGEKFLVVHGDQFDRIEREHAWLSWLGCSAYDLLTWTNQRLNDFCHWFGWSELPLSKIVKQNVKKAVQFVSDFEAQITDHAVARGCHGAICGHVHMPIIRRDANFTYCNIGDWVENCCALVEHTNGQFELIHSPPNKRYRPATAPTDRQVLVDTSQSNVPDRVEPVAA